jgi:hypothetical protein
VGREGQAGYRVPQSAMFHKISTKDLKKGKNNGVSVSHLGGGGDCLGKGIHERAL